MGSHAAIPSVRYAVLPGPKDVQHRVSSVDWPAAEWNGPLAIKGLMTPEDATRAIRSGERRDHL
ncbi:MULTISPECIES: alpha-hydroxy-acid oxidizing protein [unclassified Brevundimonas]|uniref:alpha-hydroxy-acid oxidizing protein n=1 Tax=unclassified Brevundimonas TaxID=2622653 RepID=UPI00257C56C5|nr:MULTISPECIES: alpha-hydroxy-acid oxidizing protein [unclassified Brevundimonas]